MGKLRIPTWAIGGIYHRLHARRRMLKKLDQAIVNAAVVCLDLCCDKALRLERRVQHYYTQTELVKPQESPWAKVKAARTDNGFLELTALTVAAFEMLHVRFDLALQSFWEAKLGFDRKKKGRPRTINSYDCLALVLCHYHTECSQSIMQLIFGISPAVCNRYLNDGRYVLNDVLRKVPQARVKWPNATQMQEYASRISRAQPALIGCWGFVDGLNCSIENPKDAFEQNAMYNQWLSGTFCSNVFVFDADGCIDWARLNCPGSWHDSKIADGLYDVLRYKVPQGFGIAADTAFSNSGDLKTKVFKPLKENQLTAKVNSGLSVKALIKILRAHRAAVSVRQAAEWGMGAIQRTFKRLTCVLSANHEHRRLDLMNVVFLFNFRTRVTHINQIKTVYGDGYLGRDPDRTTPWTMFNQKYWVNV